MELVFVLISACPVGFSNLFEQQCYHIVERDEDWFSAQAYCNSKNSYLVEFSDIKRAQCVESTFTR